jgi:hypothetical protein
VPADDGFGRDDDWGLLPSRPDPSSDYPEELIEEVEARARMSTLQRDELLTQSKILKKEKSHTKPSMMRIYNRTVVGQQQTMLLILRSAGVLANHGDFLSSKTT